MRRISFLIQSYKVLIMMKIKHHYVPLFIIISLLIAARIPSYAIGFGVYSSIGTGPTPLSIKGSRNHMDNSLGGGIVLDTATAMDELVNYRARIGYSSVVNNGSPFFTRYGMHRVTWSNTFGFGLVRKRNIRLWLGPQIAFDCVFKELTVPYRFKAAIPNGALYYFKSEHYRFIIPVMSFGFALGLNINMGDHFTIGLELGMLTGMGTGRYNYSENNLFITNPGMPGQRVAPVYKPHSQDYAYFKFEMTAAVCMMFRVGDTYHDAAKWDVNMIEDDIDATGKNRRPTVMEAFPINEGTMK
jgi:hypothetical protein